MLAGRDSYDTGLAHMFSESDLDDTALAQNLITVKVRSRLCRSWSVQSVEYIIVPALTKKGRVVPGRRRGKIS